MEVTAALAGRLVSAQFPQLAPAEVALLGEGWDNAAFLVNDEYVFRFPRRAIAAELIETESRILPLIAPALPAPIPVPRFAGAPTSEYPWRFAGYRAISGTVLSAVRPHVDAYLPPARKLGAFLRTLHALECGPLRAAGLPDDTIGRLDHARMMPKVRARLSELEMAGLLAESESVAAFLGEVAPAASRSECRGTVHGDLYARHLVVNSAFDLRGVIDWGDVHFGDPALDLSIGFSLFAPDARAAFFDAYGPVDDRTLDLARYRAIYHSAMVAHYGHRIGDGDLVYFGIRGLRLATR